MSQIVVNGYEGLQSVWNEITTDWNSAKFAGVIDEIESVLEIAHQGYYQNQTNPVGEGWPALSPITVKQKGHSRILYRTGRMMESLATKTKDSVREKWDETKNHGISFGTDVPYAVFHQDGTADIPQREHVGMNDRLLGNILELIADEAVRILAEHYGS